MLYSPKIQSDFFEVLLNRPQAQFFVNELQQHGELLLFGGSIRDYLNNNGFESIPRDFDIVIKTNECLDSIINTDYYSAKRNKFGGYKFFIDGLKFDVWSLQDTWAFKEHKVNFSNTEDLNKTVFLNIDALFYNIYKKELCDHGYSEAINNHELDIILSDNPYPELNIARACRFKMKFNLNFSVDLKTYIADWLNSYDNKFSAIEKLKSIEKKRYNTVSETAYTEILNIFSTR